MKNFKLIFSVLILIPNFILSTANAGTNSSARTGQIMQVVGAAANTTVGVIYMGKCPNDTPSCLLAAMSFIQAAMMVSQALQSGKTKDASACTGAYCDGSGTTPTLNPNTGLPIAETGTLPPGATEDILGRIQNDVNGQLRALGERGYSFDEATNAFNTPNGQVSAASISTPEGLKNTLGLTDADISKLNEIGKKALKDAEKMVDSYDSGGGSGGSRIKPGPGYDGDGKAFDMNKYLAGLMNKNKDRGVAGLEKKYGSDQIGVAQDNIFKMVSRRYEAKKPSLKSP